MNNNQSSLRTDLRLVLNQYNTQPYYEHYKYMLIDKSGFVLGLCNKEDQSDLISLHEFKDKYLNRKRNNIIAVELRNIRKRKKRARP